MQMTQAATTTQQTTVPAPAPVTTTITDSHWAKFQCQARRADLQGDGGRGSGSVGTHIFPIASSPNQREVVAWRMDRHEHFHFSVTIQSEELFMVSAMRRLAWQCQPQINRRIAAAGTGNDQWKRNQGRATFYFTSTANRTEFLGELSRIFPTGWDKISHDEKKTAPRQN
jgi:hypothetical protein